MKCPHCGHELTPSEIASIRGKLGAGKKKKLTKAERKRRSERMAEARKKRWEKPPKE